MAGFPSDRWAALTPRERRLLIAGGAALLLFLLYLIVRGFSGEDARGGVELADQAPVPPPAGPAPAVPLPVQPPVAAPAVPAADVSSLVLTGVIGGGPGGGAAVVATPQGPQRLVRVGSRALPGATLREVGPNYALFTTASGDVRLELRQAPPAR